MINKEKVSLTKLLVIIFCLFLFFSVISGIILYKNFQQPLGPHYAAAQVIIAQLQDSLLLKTVFINLIFYLMTSIGLIFLGILYSHRVAGPLIKVKQFAKLIGEGKYSERIQFRKKDSIHSLAASLNDTAISYEKRTYKITSMLNELEEIFESLQDMENGFKINNQILERIKVLDERIGKESQGLSL